MSHTPRRSRRTSSAYKLSPIAENAVHTWVGETQFNRGLKYIEEGMLQHTHKNGNTVNAVCEGKRHGRNFYRVRAVIAQGRIHQAFCTCSIGKYGVCPHIAAMLIEYARSPDRFKQVTWTDWFLRLLGLRKKS